MSIVWFIIKVMLWALLGSLILIVAGLTVVLLAPIHYEAYAEKYDKLIYEIHFRYLKGIKGSFHLEDGRKLHEIRVFGKILYEDKVEKKLEMHTELDNSIKKTPKAAYQPKMQVKEETVSKKIIKSSTAKNVEQTTEKAAETIKDVADNKLEQIPRSQIKDMLLDPMTHRVSKYMIKAIWDILKVVAPKEWDFEIVVGTGDPGDTGELIAKLTLLYPLYYNHGIIRGNYENQCLMGGFLIKGKFRLGQIVIRLVHLGLQKDVRAWIHFILK